MNSNKTAYLSIEIAFLSRKKVFFYISSVCLILLFFGHKGYSQNLRISGSNSHSVIICNNGSVFAWGNNNEGQIGLDVNGNPYPANFYDTPQRVYGLTEIFALDAGSGGHTLALTCDGRILSWGRNNFGQLGHGSVTPDESTPELVLGVGGVGVLSGVSVVSGGNDESFAIMNDGRAVAWGQNDKGQLGNGTNIDSQYPVYVKTGTGATDFLTDVVMVEAGDETGYALTSDGYVYSWGANGNHELGRPGADDNLAGRVQMEGGGDLVNIISISAGDRHCLAIDSDNNLWAWGGDWGAGQVGDGFNGGDYYTQDFATRVVAGELATVPANWKTEYLGDTPDTKVESIAAGQAHSIAALRNGMIVTWGSNGMFNCGNGCSIPAGQLGVGNILTTHASYTADNQSANTAPMIGKDCSGNPLTNVVEVSDGDAWTFALTSDDEIYVAGYNENGELGIGNTTSSFCFTKLDIPDCGLLSPCPKADIGSDFQTCPGFTHEFSAGLIYPGFRINWYLDGVLQESDSVLISEPSARELTYEVIDQFGDWELEIIDYRPGTLRPCEPCPTVTDVVNISPIPLPFDTVYNSYCGDFAYFQIKNADGEFAWYSSETGGVADSIGYTVDNDSILVAITDAEEVIADSVYRMWVEDVTVSRDSIAQESELCGSWDQEANNQIFTKFSVSKTVTIDTISIFIRANSNGAGSLTPMIYTSTINNNQQVPDLTNPIFTGNAFNFNYVQNGLMEVRIPVDYEIDPGTNYWIGFPTKNGGNFAFRMRSCGDAVDWTDYVDHLENGGILQFNGNYRDNNPGHSQFGGIFNMKISKKSEYPCGRIPVDVFKLCPPCLPPDSVYASVDTLHVCPGETGVILDFSADTSTIEDSKFGYFYTWFKNGSVISAYNQQSLPGAVAPDPFIEFAAIAKADSGQYIIRVEDGIDGSSKCYKEDTIELVVHDFPVPEFDPEDTIRMCQNEERYFAALNPNPTSIYSYSIDGAGGASITVDPIEDDSILVTAGSSDFVITIIEEISSGGCIDSTEYNIKVDLLPTPAVIDDPLGNDTLGFCFAESPKNITAIFASTDIGTGTWSVITPGGGINFGDVNAPITEVLDLDENEVLQVMWEVTNGVCPPSRDTIHVGAAEAVDPSVTLVADTNFICTDGTTDIVFTATATNGGPTPLFTFYDGQGTVLQAESASDTYTLLAANLTQDTSVYVILNSSSGCLVAKPDSNIANSATLLIDVDLEPSPVDIVEDDMTVCISQVELNLSVDPSTLEGIGAWRVEDNLIGSVSPTTGTPVTFTFRSGVSGSTDVYYLNESENGYCPATGDTVNLTKTGDLTTPDAGPDTSICTGTNLSIQGSIPDVSIEEAVWESLDAGPTIAYTSTDNSAIDISGFPNTPGVPVSEYRFVYHIYSQFDSLSCNAQDTLTVSVLNTPEQPDGIIGTNQSCPGEDYTYTVPPVTGASSYVWEIRDQGGVLVSDAMARIINGDGTNSIGILFDENKTITTATILEITVAAENSCGTSLFSTPYQVQINPEVTPAITIDAISPICEGESLTFATTIDPADFGAGANILYSWYLEGAPVNDGDADPSSLILTGLSDQQEVSVYAFSTYSCVAPGSNPAQDAVTVTVNDTIIVDIQLEADDYEPCEGQDVDITATIASSAPAGTFTWSSSTTAPGPTTSTETYTMAAGSNTIDVTYTFADCPAPNTPSQASIELTATPNETIAVSLAPASTAVCYGSAGSTFTATKTHTETGGTYSWIINSGSPVSGNNSYTMSKSLQPGTYTVEVEFTSGLKCTVSPTATAQSAYEVIALPEPTISGGTVFCPLGTTTLTGTAGSGGALVWYPSSNPGSTTPGTSLTVGTEGLYVLEETDANGCIGKDRVVVTEFDNDATIFASQESKCEGDEVTLTVDRGDADTYDWTLDGGAITETGQQITVIPQGEYVVNMTLQTADGDICNASADITISDILRPRPNIIEEGMTICETDPIALTVEDSSNISGVTVRWYKTGTPDQQVGTGNPLSGVSISGEYYAEVEHQTCVGYSDKVEIIADLEVKAVVSPAATYITEGEVVSLSGLGSVNAFSYYWSSEDYEGPYSPRDSAGSILVRPIESTNVFILKVESEHGQCVDEDSGYVYVEKQIRPWNSFSPNGDGKYDEWIIENLETFPNALIEVYNRWGTLVWRSEGYQAKWKGENFRNGQELPVATYYYVIYPNGGKVKEPKAGDVTIVK